MISPRTSGHFATNSPAFYQGPTWIESEALCTDHGKFERFGLVRHALTNKLVRTRLDVPDTYFSIPATTATEHGYVGIEDLEEYGKEFYFHPHTSQIETPAQYRKDLRTIYK